MTNQRMPQVWNKRDPSCPKDAVYVGRPSKWGNPYRIGAHCTREQSIRQYEEYLASAIQLQGHSFLAELRGKDLVCWCAPLPCHADVLLEVANA